MPVTTIALRAVLSLIASVALGTHPVASDDTLSGSSSVDANTIKKKKVDKFSDEQLAGVYVFYSDPPLDFEPSEAISIKIRSYWDRDKIERRVREEVAAAGGNVIFLSRSYSELDRAPTIIPRARGRKDIQVSAKSFYVAGQIGRHTGNAQALEAQRSYQRDFSSVWGGVLDSVKGLGWQVETIDTDSRYLLTTPVSIVPGSITCEEQPTIDHTLAFAIFVTAYNETTRVRLDTRIFDKDGGEPAKCHSSGVYEESFFLLLD